MRPYKIYFWSLRSNLDQISPYKSVRRYFLETEGTLHFCKVPSSFFEIYKGGCATGLTRALLE